MGIAEMKRYVQLCLEGVSSIPERKRMLDDKRKALLDKIEEINESIAFIDNKQRLYDAMLADQTADHERLLLAPEEA